MLGNFPDLFIAEIAEQPNALRRAAKGLADQSGQVQQLAWGQNGRVVFTGMGGSLAACHPAVTVLNGAGVAAEMVDAAELLHYRLPSIGSGDLIVAVSQSGESAETVKLLSAIRDAGRPTRLVSVTNGLQNSLSSLAEIALDTCAGAEEGPSTITFAASLVVLAALVGALRDGWNRSSADSLVDAAEEVAGVVEALVAEPAALAGSLREWLDERTVLAVVGRGVDRAAADMGALTLKETARFPAESLQSAQFRHGPLELAGAETAVLIIAGEAATRRLEHGLAQELAATGTRVLLLDITGTRGKRLDASIVDGTARIALAPLNRLLSPAATVVPCQLLAWALGRERGRQPGKMQHATKVTMRE